MGFQTVVNANQAPAVAGDFASQNPRASVLASAGQLVAPSGGLKVGHFAFVSQTTGLVSQSYASGNLIGFLPRVSQGLITTFLADSSIIVPQGFMVTLFDAGEFWAFARAACPSAGVTIYADEASGAIIPGSATSTVTASAGATGTASFSGAVMTVATVSAGVVCIGDVVNATGVATSPAVTVTAQLTGTAGGVGTYSLSASVTTEATEAFTTTSTTLSVSAVLTGGIWVGDTLSGTGVTSGTMITAGGPAQPYTGGQAAGVGGVGTYTLSVGQNFAATTVTQTLGNVATNFKARSVAAVGELVMISSWGP